MRKLLNWAAPLALVCAPGGVAAQDEGGAELDIFAGMAQLFTAEPLTAEQQARLPAAEALVNAIIPPGSLQDVMGSMFDTFLTPLASTIEPDAAAVLAERLDLAGVELDLTPEQAETAATLLDPAWRTRKQREAESLPAMTGRMMGAMEPAMRTAMAELYAIHFTDAELVDISAFFATPSGASYARKSLTMTSDPRLAATIMQQMPAMFEAMAAMEAEMVALTADLPPVRTYADLSPAERKGLAQMLGMTAEDLQFALEWGDEVRDEGFRSGF
ncbi:DUF2059 domain-containing protein [Altererythrobacter sp. KTW20L]|uniref:DUF2059 domain-containing protein n=1 Tax=Altererythrobacter sp. KTW20L TaxID=2942210 RepID=UPI0020C05624|nr:DUF2059 domain-containing protein [Altererythrobacter sp. KTW20L]MCL6249854.1 DUF2059 domain-containing protein [Altererythrobacter sp. KTW20L]